VARLHKRIGKLEMVDLEFLSGDRFVQRTTFADGTRIIANLGIRSVRTFSGGYNQNSSHSVAPGKNQGFPSGSVK